ncbi:LacI family DNA-binding transcriptional regulator [Streptomyces sp. DASNCL29]|uniref:LacI family DNA-binding transcriptional regulator n=1 Tax=Streptomyces sp. DASNCL29 TaxID=2583819 RepID=UPI00110FED27|nr:LacI family DNA-binding transcriptional regulator [Streptomyces sp. DASNCL29]TMU98052.1 LacI family DNA-binding transcriptional regulator [Streptomyces sp. DASNCL29]
MAYTEKRRGRDGKDYYRGRYLRPDGRGYDTVKGADSRAIKFPTKRTALKAAQDAESEAAAAAKRGGWVAPEKGRTTLGEYVLGPDGSPEEGWAAKTQDLAASSHQSYGYCLKHILPTFADSALADITSKMIDVWERKEKETGAVSSVSTYRKILHLILADAVDEGLIATNPAARRRGRGKRAGRASNRGPEKKITSALGALLLAERASLLSGRDDEFVACTAKSYTGKRWGELVGLEPEFVRPDGVAGHGVIRVEWQLYELDSGELVRCPPKDDSYRDVDAPAFLARLVMDHIARAAPEPCSCHRRRYVFRGRGPAGGGARREGPTLVDVAKLAGVSTGTVSNVLNRPERVAEATRVRVEKAVAELGFTRRTGTTGDGAHWRRSGFSTWIFEPAASGHFPKKGPYERRPVPVSAGPWPGLPVRGRNSQGRAEACWVPIKGGLTRHGLRHGHRTLMEELGTPKVLMDERLGHTDSSVSANYSHVTSEMRARLCEQLTEVWEAALSARLALCRTSAVPVLERLLREHEAALEGRSKIVSHLAPRRLPA